MFFALFDLALTIFDLSLVSFTSFWSSSSSSWTGSAALVFLAAGASSLSDCGRVRLEARLEVVLDAGAGALEDASGATAVALAAGLLVLDRVALVARLGAVDESRVAAFFRGGMA